MIAVEKVERDKMKAMIVEMKDGVLTAEDNKALESCTAYATHLWVGYVNDSPVCAWGLVPPTFLSDCAYLWLYASPEVDAHKFIFVRNSQIVMKYMREIYPLIYGVTEAKNHRAIRWLKWLGAKFTYPKGRFLRFTIGEVNG
jgi:hypothetical protein